MPHMKYYQGLGDIYNHYENIFSHLEKTWGHELVETWGIDPSNEEELKLIQEEKDVVRYLIGCQTSVVHDENALKPTVEAAQRCFNRHLHFLNLVHECNENTVKNASTFKQREYHACRYYLSKFRDGAWLEKLPNRILTLENKYPE